MLLGTPLHATPFPSQVALIDARVVAHLCFQLRKSSTLVLDGQAIRRLWMMHSGTGKTCFRWVALKCTAPPAVHIWVMLLMMDLNPLDCAIASTAFAFGMIQNCQLLPRSNSLGSSMLTWSCCCCLVFSQAAACLPRMRLLQHTLFGKSGIGGAVTTTVPARRAEWVPGKAVWQSGFKSYQIGMNKSPESMQ